MGNKRLVLSVVGSAVFLFTATTAIENLSFAAAATNKVTKQYKILCKKGAPELKNPKSKICDFDRDGIVNGAEKKKGTDWKKPRTNGADIDGSLDLNGNGIPDALENKKLRCVDRDGDSTPDALEDVMGILPGKKNDLLPDSSDSSGWTRAEVENYLNCDIGSPSPTPVPGATATPRPTAATGATPTPKPTIPAGSTPTKTPTPKPSGGNSCDTSGNTTGFGIPAGKTGNKNRGHNIWTSTCQGCHGTAKRGSSYQTIWNSASRPEMAAVAGLIKSGTNCEDLTADRNC